MATEQYVHYADIRDAHILTRVLDEKRPETRIYDVPFAPLYAFNGRKVKLVVRRHEGAGLASFKADNANTPVVTAVGELQEVYIELALIAEKEVLESSTLISLESMDDRIARMAAEDVVDKALRLQQRNVNRTRWMAWQAVKDELTVTYGDVTLSIDWDLDGDAMNDHFSGSHLPTAATAWTDTANADIIEDVHTWAKLIGNDLGVDESEVVMMVNSETWRYLKKNTGIRGELSSFNPRVITPRREDVIEVLEIADVQLRNDFYFDENGTKQKLLPNGKALLMPRGFQYNGVPIVEMYDGLVARVINGRVVVERNPGMLAEIYVNEEQVAENVRVQTARMPIVNHPAGIVYATAYTE